MALLTKNHRISVKPFADIPALDGLPPIVQHAAPSVSNLSSRQGTDTGMIEGWTEGCLVTNTLKYTHRIVHWVNVAQGRDPSNVEEVLIDLDIGFPSPYWLDMDCNLNYLEAFIHTSLDLYALIAITASASTLEDLITMVKHDNDARQAEIDQTGAARPRFINLDSPSFTHPELELVALHPEHFLPRGSILTIYDPTTATHKNYVPATDRRLRESPDPTSPPLPAFHQITDRPGLSRPNIFLVILNAEIKFRRYFRMSPPTTPLPSDVLALMHHTMELVELLYWKPVPTKGSAGEQEVARTALRDTRRNLLQSGKSGPVRSIEKGASGEREMEMNEQGLRMQGELDTTQFPPPGASRHQRREWWINTDLETRMAYGRSLMSGHDYEYYDPALFEDTVPLDDSHLYSEPGTVEAWQRGVTSTDKERQA